LASASSAASAWTGSKPASRKSRTVPVTVRKPSARSSNPRRSDGSARAARWAKTSSSIDPRGALSPARPTISAARPHPASTRPGPPPPPPPPPPPRRPPRGAPRARRGPRDRPRPPRERRTPPHLRHQRVQALQEEGLGGAGPVGDQDPAGRAGGYLGYVEEAE